MINTYRHVFPEVWFEITAGGGGGGRKIKKFFKMAQFICTQVYGGDWEVMILSMLSWICEKAYCVDVNSTNYF